MTALLDPRAFRDVVSGRRRDLGASLLRASLGAIEGPYRWTVTRRNRWYDAHPEAVHRAAVPVVSVGNLTLGGTGKTPLVAWLVDELRTLGVKAAVVSRGYGSRQGRPNDEALELAQKLPHAPHVQNPDRVAAVRQAIERYAAQAIVLDDAFQHRRMGRDLDIVLLDALEPFGFDHVFPRGTLREPVEGLRRAQVVVLSRADMLSADQRHAIHQRAASLAPAAAWLEAAHAPGSLVTLDGAQQPLAELAGRSVVAICGIGNPDGFRHTLERCGCQTVALVTYPDHHLYSQADLDAAMRLAERESAEAIVCTEKDIVKLRGLRQGERPVFAIRIGLEFLTDPQPLMAKLEALT